MSNTTALPPIAHSAPDGSEGEPLFTSFGDAGEACQRSNCRLCIELEPVHGHLNKVAFWAARFAADLFPGNSVDSEAAMAWGHLAGLWHDLGKFAPSWQAYIRRSIDGHADDFSGRVDHSTAGAQYAAAEVPLFGHLLAYVIAGHHAGLANGIDDTEGCLEKRLRKAVASYSEADAEALGTLGPLGIPAFALESSGSLAFYVRMVFSCLVDADFLATESFMAPDRRRDRGAGVPSVGELERALDRHLARLSMLDSPVNRHRAAVLTACRERAEDPPGLFSLTVPTGGGKTLSSLAFALRHARLHRLERVIYVMPFTAIIEQNAAVFRDVFAMLGNDIVIEHHTGLDPDSAHATTTSRLLAENWNARLIVTTNVQFFESLHANRASRCRKLHRMARSIVVLDEAQALPIHLLDPCLRTIEELTRNYGTSIVLCTATQPALHYRPDFVAGLPPPTEIIPDPPSLYRALRRVTLQQLGTLTPEDLVARLTQEHQALCIVNTRREARAVFELLPREEAVFHLSALMCPAHRFHLLQRIRQRLDASQRVLLVSTQLIEAGVDIDFPAVYRCEAGLDSVAQAAGRCDREGFRTSASGAPAGRVYLFDFGTLPPVFLRRAVASTREVAATFDGDLLSLEAMERFFQVHLWRHRDELDEPDIRACWPLQPPSRMRTADELLLFQFKRCAESFRLIDDHSLPVVIPYGNKGAAVCSQLRTTQDTRLLRRLARRLQRFTVTIPAPQHERLRCEGILHTVHDIFFLLNSTVHYNDQTGLQVDPGNPLTVDQFVI